MDSSGQTPSQRGEVRRALVIGSGASGLMAALALVRSGVPVRLVSAAPALASSSALEVEGFNAARQAGDDPTAHARDMAGDAEPAAAGSASDPPRAALSARAARSRGLALAVAERALSLRAFLERSAVPFDRGIRGEPRLYQALGNSAARSALVRASTGFHVVRALLAQVTRAEATDIIDSRGLARRGEKWIERDEAWELVRLVKDGDGTVVGVVVQHVHTMALRSFKSDGVCLATGGLGSLLDHAAASGTESGSALLVAFENGAVVQDLDRFHLWPTAYRGSARWHLIGDGARLLGARLWCPRRVRDERPPNEIPDRDREYFAEAPELDTPARLAACIFAHGFTEPFGVFDRASSSFVPGVYQDATHLGPIARAEIEPFFAHYRALAGTDATRQPIAVAPAVKMSLGGLWVDFEFGADGRPVLASPRSHATTLPGLYAAGGVACWPFERPPQSGDELLSCLFSGECAGRGIHAYRESRARSAFDLSESVFERAEAGATDDQRALLERVGSRAPWVFELGSRMRSLLRPLAAPAAFTRLSHLDMEELTRSLDEIEHGLRTRTGGGDEVPVNRHLLVFRRTQHELRLARALAHAFAVRHGLQSSTSKAEPGDAPIALVASDDGSPRRLVRWGYDAAGNVADLSPGEPKAGRNEAASDNG